MQRQVIIAISLFSVILFIPSASFAGGLSTHFVEVKLENLEPGKTYSVKEATKRTLTIKNTTENKTVDIEIIPEKPVAYNLVPGYDPIPDLLWIKINKNYYEKIGPGVSAETDIFITIPNSKEYYGKKYQVYIYSYTAGETTFRIGLMSRILIETAPAKP